jgi:hypothetical protein
MPNQKFGLDRGESGREHEGENWLERKVESSKLTRTEKYLVDLVELFPEEFEKLSNNFRQAASENRITIQMLIDTLNAIDEHWSIASETERSGVQAEILKVLYEYGLREQSIEKGKRVSDYHTELIGKIHDVGPSDEVGDAEEGTIVGLRRRSLIGINFVQPAEPVRFKKK